MRHFVVGLLAAMGAIGCSEPDAAVPGTGDSVTVGSAAVSATGDAMNARAVLTQLRAHFGDTALAAGDGAPAGGAGDFRYALPSHGDAPLVVGDEASGVSVEVALRGAVATPMAFSDGLAVYDGALDGQPMILRGSPSSVEDHVRVEAGVNSLTYDLVSTRVSAWRMRNGGADVLDEEGRARLHVAEPHLIDSAGVVRVAALRLVGCAEEAARCALEVAWDPAGLTYPVLVDPVWTPLSIMREARAWHTLTYLAATDEVLGIGGARLSNEVNGHKAPGSSSAELFDINANTWTFTGSMGMTRLSHTATLLTNGDVLVTGGLVSGGLTPTNTAEIYNRASGAFTSADAMSGDRYDHTATMLPSGDVLVVGGLAAPERYSGSMWDAASSGAAGLRLERIHHTASLLGDHVVITGGRLKQNASTAFLTTATSLTAVYDTTSDTWSAEDPLNINRFGHEAAVVNGQLYVAGGRACGNGCATLTSVERYEPGAPVGSRWVLMQPMNYGRSGFTLSGLSNGRLLATGGGECFEGRRLPLPIACGSTATSELFDPSAGPLGTWTLGPSLSSVRSAHGMTMLSDGAVLVSGGASCRRDLACDPNGCTQPDALDCDPPERGTQVFRLADNGAACALDAVCKSGHCVDGVCCDTACDSACQRCDGVTAGVCEAVETGPDPRGLCDVTPVTSCLASGDCTTGGVCAFWPAGETCGPDTCNDSAVSMSACTGLGACEVTSSSCGTFACDGVACGTSCVTDDACSAVGYCNNGTCVPRTANGEACIEDRTCRSGSCADGVCCDRTCDGQCEACSITGAEGTCVAVTGIPVGDRTACATDDPANPCSERVCDGEERTACAGFVADVPCRDPSCEDGTETHVGYCQGGTCPDADGEICAPFTCGSSMCLDSCVDDADCVDGFGCFDEECSVPPRCDDASDTVITGDGERFPCEPGYRCEDGACGTSCGETAECARGYVCDPFGRCVPQPDDSGPSDHGCRCTAAGRDASSSGFGIAWLMLAMALRRRRS